MKKTLLLLLPLMLTLGACTDKKQETKPSNSDSGDVTPDWGETSTKTIVFKGAKNRSGLTSGSQLNEGNFNNVLTNYINEQADDSLTALGGKKCTMQLVGGDSGSDTSLTIGTGSANGLIYFTFNLDIVKIDVTIQNYYKPHHDYEQNIDVSGIDQNAEVTICSYVAPATEDGEGTIKESQKVNLSTTDTVNVPSERDASFALKEATNTIAFKNDEEKHRTYIHSLTVTYLVK